MRVPLFLDRYPAKMVSHLANTLVDRYSCEATHILDPFCGSGAILMAGSSRNIPTSGVDINPYAALLSDVKMNGFNAEIAREKCAVWVNHAKGLPRDVIIQSGSINWRNKLYWFDTETIYKYESLRAANHHHSLFMASTPEGKACLLAYALSVRCCSRADQRSPKPFISKRARTERLNRFYCPYSTIDGIMERLVTLYGKPSNVPSAVYNGDARYWRHHDTKFSHVITSPPYINAQDYFRNSKLELNLMEGLLPYQLAELRARFIGTEGGDLLKDVPQQMIDLIKALIPDLRLIAEKSPRSAMIVIRYFADMDKCFDNLVSMLETGGTLVVVCGDNIVAGTPISTWKVVNELLTRHGFALFDQFGDNISCRMLAPKRNGHKGLIKSEIVSAFRKIDKHTAS